MKMKWVIINEDTDMLGNFKIVLKKIISWIHSGKEI